MRWFLTIVFLLLLTPVFPQEDMAALAKQLAAGQPTERGKVTAIFKWITGHIAYRVATRKQPVIKMEEPDEGPLKPLNERVAETVLKKREAVCDGYARLFTTLCDYAGINSVVILGYARGGTHPRFAVNHYWNGVQIDGKWFLLDATWASGYLSLQRNEFIRDYDEKYFLADPELFIRDHYPDDPRWTLLPDTKVPEEFRRSPFKQKSFSKYAITSFYPAGGIIEAFIGDTIRLQLETALTEKERNICPDLLADSTLYTHSPAWVFLKPGGMVAPNQHNYIYTVATPGVEWLYLIYNDDLVLRYKINVKRKG